MPERMKKVSVIIPVYNVEKYLPDCLDSVLGQTMRELECICIDDASPDRGGEILDEYAAREERVRVLHLPENHMQGYGRNRGLEMAEGKYVYFLDSDDMITPNAMEELYQLAERDDLEGIYFDSQVLLESEDLATYAEYYICKRTGEYPDEVMTGQALMELFMENREWMVFVQRQFWRRDYLMENKIFSPERTEHEDELFSFMAALLARRVRYTRKDYFIHRYRSDSVMTRPPHPKDFVGYFRIFTRAIEFADEHQLSGPGVDGFIAHMYSCALRFQDDFRRKADPAEWLLPDELGKYFLFGSIQKSQEIMREQDELLWGPLFSYDSIWLYGAGRVARRVFVRLRSCGIRVKGFLVTNAENNPDQLFDLPVRSIGAVDRLPDGSAVVVAMSKTLHNEPAKILQGKNIPYFLYFNNVLTGPHGGQSE